MAPLGSQMVAAHYILWYPEGTLGMFEKWKEKMSKAKDRNALEIICQGNHKSNTISYNLSDFDSVNIKCLGGG